MDLTPRQIAEAFSGHRFEVTTNYLAEDVHWNPVGQKAHEGRDAVIAACEESAKYLSGVETTFDRFRVIEAEGAVVVDSLARYEEPSGGKFTVGSCDIYDFSDGRVTAITSYATEIGA